MEEKYIYLKEDKKIIGVQVPMDMFLAIKKIADERFISMSDVVRSVLFKWLEEREENNDGK